MAATLDSELEEKIAQLEAKSERVKSAKDLESRLTSAVNSIERINQKLQSLDETADELSFYVEILESVFGGNRPEAVEEAISTAHSAANIDDETIIDAAERQDFSDVFSSIENAEAELEDAIDLLDGRITDEYQSPWEDELEAARELNRIIGGGNDEFLDVISSMEIFFNRAIWDLTNDTQSLSARWDRLHEEWEENAGKHGWEPFQREHGLSNTTIEDLKQFTTKDTVRLSDLSLPTLEEVKEVGELESALQVELKS